MTGQHEDARMCLALALTAARMGATVANHTEVTQLLKKQDPENPDKEIIWGAKVKDKMTGNKKLPCFVRSAVYDKTSIHMKSTVGSDIHRVRFMKTHATRLYRI